MTEMNQKPMIAEIILVSGEIINDARLEVNAHSLPGFIAIVDQRTSDATRYIALSAIESITMMNTELARFKTGRFSHYVSPEVTIKARVNNEYFG